MTVIVVRSNVNIKLLKNKFYAGKIVYNGKQMPRLVDRLVSGCFASNKDGGKDERL